MNSMTSKLGVFITTLFMTVTGHAQDGVINATIDASSVSAPISRYIYGQFLEHGADIVNEGVWAEMLADRKFYYPITSKVPEEPPVPEFRRRGPRRTWMPIGGDDVVTMDTKNPFTGEQTPLVRLDKTIPHGFRQSRLAVRNGKSYIGRIMLAGSGNASIKVTLVWGKGEGDRQAVIIPRVTSSYHKYPVSFQAKADSEETVLEVTGTGTGEFHVGAISLMPADNVQGFRKEVVEALKQLDFGVLRFPGGNFVSAHEWRNAVGDIDKRPPIYDPVWKAVQPNDVGTDEFITLCKLLNVDPYITVNAGFGDAWSARELVEYANGAVTTPMGKWRAANGHPQPYNVKLWGVGNEPWGDWQMGYIPVAQFSIKQNLFAKAMRKVDPSIKLIAAGATPDALTANKQALRLGGKLTADYLSPGDWTGSLLVNSLDYMGYVSEHYYARSNQRFDANKGEKVDTGPQSLVEWSRAPANLVRVKYEHYQEYERLIPRLKEKHIPIALDEWAYTGSAFGSYKVVPAYAWAFHEMFRHSDLYQLGGFTFATAMVSANRTDAELSPVGLLFKMYSNHFGSIPVAVNGDSPQPKQVNPPGGDQPKVLPGSPTYPLDVSAAFTADRKTFTIAVVNPSDAEQRLNLNISGTTLAANGQLWRLAPTAVDASNVIGKKSEVEIESGHVSSTSGIVVVAPFSVTIYSYAVQ